MVCIQRPPLDALPSVRARKKFLISSSPDGIIEAMQRFETRHHPDLALSRLPGPDTRTKREALETHDPRLKLLLAEAARIAWPSAYTDDLYLHDRQQLERHPQEELLWILREHGTHLYPTQCDNSHEASFYRQVIEYWSGDHKLNFSPNAEERARYYLVTESTLTPITWQQARDALKVRTSTLNTQLTRPPLSFD